LSLKNVFESHTLLGQLPQELVDQLQALSRTQTYTNNQAIFFKGDPASGMMTLVSGNVKIVSYASNGKEIIFKVLGPGEVLGEIALIDGGNRTAEARAIGATELLFFDRKDFLPLLETDPTLCIALLKVLCQRLRSTDEQLEDFTFLDLRLRLAKCLVQLGSQHLERDPSGKDVRIIASQQMLASMMGATREAVNKRLREWEEGGMLSLGRGFVILHDLEAFKKVV